ncbi:MAG: hypothetical protein R6W66_08290 [Pelovirga sp.]
MDIFTELERVTRHEYEHGELPAWLAEPIFRVIENAAHYQGKDYLVEMLIDQLNEYDVYAEAGCCRWASDHEDIKRTLDKLNQV